jgi:thioredoxin 1
MNRPLDYATTQPELADIEALAGPTLLEFGVDWCPHCQAALGPLSSALNGQPAIRHVKIEDGPGRPLGRFFHVKLWPTLILLQDGHEVARLVRPTGVEAITEALGKLAD